jgi:S1-C subfamily serine protease
MNLSNFLLFVFIGGSIGGCASQTVVERLRKDVAIKMGKEVALDFNAWISEAEKLADLKRYAARYAMQKCNGQSYRLTGVVSRPYIFPTSSRMGADIICISPPTKEVRQKFEGTGYLGPKIESAEERKRRRRQAQIELAKKEEEKRQREEAERKSKIAANKKPAPPPISSTSGSGFFVSKLGHVVTNQHVVGRCQSVTVGDSARKQVAAEIVATDNRNDLALLKISSTKTASADTKSLLRKLGVALENRNIPLSSDGLLRSKDVELGERVMVSGYPYGEIFSDTIKVTGGMVSAIRGMGDDSGQFQIDAAVQPGNSGGPIYDGKGNIVGVVVSQLNKLKVAKVIGSLPENVNFGIKASTVRQFLTSAGLPTKWSSQSEPVSSKNLAKIAKNQTLMVVCNH